MICKAKTKTGKPCQAQPQRGKPYCFTHDPAQATARAHAHKKGGQRTRTKHGGEILPRKVRTLGEAQAILDYTLSEIEQMPNSLQRARVLIALFDSFVKALEIGELEARIAALVEGRKNDN